MASSYRVDYKCLRWVGAEPGGKESHWTAHSDSGLSLEEAKRYAEAMAEVYVHVRIVKTTIEHEEIQWQES